MTHIQPQNTDQPKRFFTFEGKQYYAQTNAPGRIGPMLFTGSGIACEKTLHTELWMFYEQQHNYDELKKSEIF